VIISLKDFNLVIIVIVKCCVFFAIRDSVFKYDY
jgi:hypothetical protein